jgi:acetyl esterase/lipase
MRKRMFTIAPLVLVAVAAFAATPAPPATAPSSRPSSAATLISAVDTSKYKVEGNIPYDTHPATLLDMIYPKDMKKNDPSANNSKKFPGVIMFHGGGWIRTSKSTMPTFYNRFLSHGFVVCNAEYRMADNTGQFSPENSPAPAAVEDALKAAKWFWDHADEYNVDKSRIVVTGASAGGHLALMVGLCTDSSLGPTAPKDFKIAAIVNGYGPADVPDLLQRRTSWAVQWLPPETPDRDALAKKLSPMTYVCKDIPPLITVQGSRDTTVPIIQNQHLTEALKAAGADVDMHIVEGAAHGFTNATWPDAEKAMFDFLEKHKIIP